MKRYRLKKDLPTYSAGEEFYIDGAGNLKTTDGAICAYCRSTLVSFPNILTNWFEEIPEEPKTVWDLEELEEYFYISWDGYVQKTVWDDISADKGARDFGNCFLTAGEAERERARRKAKQVILRDTKGFQPSIAGRELYYVVAYDYDTKDFTTYSFSSWRMGVEITFPTEADALVSIKAHEKEWKIYLGVEDD